MKISFTFYLFTSLCKALTNFKKKPLANPTLQEGLLLLVHEHFKALSRSRNPLQNISISNVSGSSSFSSDSDDIQSISSEGEDTSNLDKSVKGKVKISLVGSTPCRKSPRGHGTMPSGQEEMDYNDEDEDVGTDEEDKEKDSNMEE